MSSDASVFFVGRGDYGSAALASSAAGFMRDALCCVGGDATDEEEGKSLLDWNGIKIVETDCMLPTDRVKPYARNAKRHPQEQIDEIKASIKRFGMDDPIGIWGKENLIVEGHGRLEACKQLGIPTVPCIRLDHLTKEERKAYTLAHNKTNMDSGWDFTSLDQELAEIVDVDMSEFGFGASLGGQSVNIDEFFTEKSQQGKEPKIITCPHCGKTFEK